MLNKRIHCRLLSWQLPLPVVILAVLLFSRSPAVAQPPILSNKNSPINLTARFHVEKGKQTGFLIVKAVIPAGSHIYSLNQKPPLSPTKIAITKMDQLQASGKFKADKSAHVVEKDPIFDARVETHTGKVQFYVPIKIAPGVDPAPLIPTVIFSGQVCSDEGFCIPIQKQKVLAKFAGFFQREAKQSFPLKTHR